MSWLTRPAPRCGAEVGAWGSGSFENDNALDWVHALRKTKDDRMLRDAFGYALAQTYIEAPVAEEAIAAAEVIASAFGWPTTNLPKDVRDWVSNYSETITAQTAAVAVAALDRIVAASELRELWEEAGSLDEWLPIVADLKDRLGRP